MKDLLKPIKSEINNLNINLKNAYDDAEKISSQYLEQLK
jgi:hypothetical protein